MSNNVDVSIICIAYNHEKYLRQCLDCFIMQKDITFEIIIHDDASTDKTTDIIREYEKKYPHLLKPIYQRENIYSRNISRSDFILPLITGKYVAICEGDDYWTDPYKLKKQYDALESNPDCYMSGHKVSVVRENGSDIGYTCPRKDIKSEILPKGYVCKNYDNAKYIHTSSFFIRTEYYNDFLLNAPVFYLIAPVGDVPTLLYFTALGKIVYFNEVMSHYRFMSIGSWSYKNYNSSEKEKRRRDIDKKMKAMFVEYCNYTNNKYDDCFKDVIKKLDANEYWYCINHKDYKTLFKEFSVNELKEFGLNRKAMLKMKLQIWFPKLFK